MKKNLSRIFLTIIIIFSFLCINYFSISTVAYEKQNQNIRKSLTPGDYFRFLLDDGRIRSYRIHIPLGYSDENPVPLVFMLHGTGTLCNSYTTQLLYDLNRKSDEEGFILVYPNGERMHRWYAFNIPFPIFELWELITWSRTWNFWDYNNFDDVDFLRNLINHLQDNFNINASRIYITGHSGGAMMTYRLGAELSDIIAAISPVSGSIGGSWFDSIDYIIPDPINPLPVLVIHGVKDQAVPYYGGWQNITYLFRTSSGYFKSVNESVSFWVEHNQCDPEPLVNTSASGRIIIETYVNGSNGTKVVLYSYLDGDHGWNPTSELSVNDLIWDFFEKNPKKV